jgi:hypothetical protein
MFDAVEMMRKTWSGMNVPSSLQPTMDIGEIDRRIADLRVVEQWLQLNQTMLQTTIQTLEIQRNTVAAFQAFTKAGAMVASAHAPSAAVSQPVSAANTPSVSPAVNQPAGPAESPNSNTGPRADNPSGSSIAAAQAALWWDFLQQPFRQMTEAANRHHTTGSADQPAPTTTREIPPTASHSANSSSTANPMNPPTKPSNAQLAAEFGQRSTTRSALNQPADQDESPSSGRSRSTQGPKS